MNRGPDYEQRMQLRSIESRFKAIEEQISAQSKFDRDIIDHLHRIAVREARQEQLSDLEERKQVLASVYESAAGYSNLIMAADRRRLMGRGDR